ncbi:MAG: hypothetical protein HY260_17645 [Chloroflexi bacterium]|nr:hypothetical protein [Chloroflexota bacterium]
MSTDALWRISTDGPLGLAVVLLFAALMAGFALFARRARKGTTPRPPAFRPIEAYSRLPRAIGEAVETGRRLHISLGSGSVGASDTASILAGLTIVEIVAQAASASDKPPVVTAGDGTASILAQDALRRVYTRQNLIERYDPNAGRLAGATPLSFAAGAMMTVPDETTAANLVTGSFGTEIALITEAGARAGITQIAGAGDPTAQALAYAGADHPLVGEELYVAGAYLRSFPAHVGSVRAQDAMRVLIVVAIVVLAIARALGLGTP